MSANVGLSTPRGSGTSGYVQRNLSLLKPRDAGYGAPYPPKDALPPRQRKPDRDILEHDRRRKVEVEVLELRDRLEDEGKLDEDEMDAECDKLRAKLLADDKEDGRSGKGLKMHQVHELAEVKMRESERLRKALGLKDGEVGEGEDGGEHPMARQERRRREEEVRREKLEVERLERERERQKEEEVEGRDRSAKGERRKYER